MRGACLRRLHRTGFAGLPESQRRSGQPRGPTRRRDLASVDDSRQVRKLGRATVAPGSGNMKMPFCGTPRPSGPHQGGVPGGPRGRSVSGSVGVRSAIVTVTVCRVSEAGCECDDTAAMPEKGGHARLASPTREAHAAVGAELPPGRFHFSSLDGIAGLVAVPRGSDRSGPRRRRGRLPKAGQSVATSPARVCATRACIGWPLDSVGPDIGLRLSVARRLRFRGWARLYPCVQSFLSVREVHAC